MRGKRSLPAALLLAGTFALPAPAWADLSPLVREMLENLGAVNEVGQGVAIEDYEQVEQAAAELSARADRLKKLDISKVGLDAARDAKFDGYLLAQQQASAEILRAAKQEDGRAVILGLQRLFRNACVPCHSDFREAANLLGPATLFMTSFLNSWQDVNRGLSINDLTLVERAARELSSMTKVLSWDQVIESAFGIEDPEERREFRKILRHVGTNATRMATAADEDDKLGVVNAASEMWADGCISCHEKFR